MAALLRTCLRAPIVALSSFALLLVSCDNGTGKVEKPDSDSTPPSLVWNVLDHATGDQADHPGSPTLGATRGDGLRIILKASDPQGVQSIEINPSLGGGELMWQCVDPPGGESLAQNKFATLGPQTQNLSPDADGMVLTSIFLIQELDLAMGCQPGWSFQSGTAKLTGKASNYFSGATTEVIMFNITP